MMPPSLDVIGIGHITCDIICPIHGWPEPDTKNIVAAIALAGGGPSANAIAALAKLNVRCGLVGKLGDDLLGRYTIDAHLRSGIEMSRVVVSPQSESPVSIILSDLAAGTRTILLTKGRETTLSVADLDWDWLKQARIIHIDGHQMPASLAVAQAAQDWPDCQVVFDAGSLREGMIDLCKLSDIVIASRRFARELTVSDSPDTWLRTLLNLGAKQAGVTLGASGSVMAVAGKTYRQPAFPIAVQDTTGAGDSYHGGFIYGLLRGYGPQECMRFASAVAAVKCTGIGARQNLPSLDEIKRFLQEHPIIPSATSDS